jgi:hypothetical protein
VNLTRQLPAERREHVEARLHSNLIAWLTTVRPDGQPDSVPVWFLVRDDDTILVYSQPKRVMRRSTPSASGRCSAHLASSPNCSQKL